MLALVAGSWGATASAQEPVTLTYLVDTTGATGTRAQGLADAFMAQNPNVTIEIETRPQGGEGDNLVKTRLQTGEMNDLFWYNSGSLLQALNPAETILDVSGEPFIENIVESFLPTVSQGEGIYGVPSETAMGGGVLYNKTVYSDLGLSVPTTWAELAANNDAIKAAGIAPMGATFGADSTWTSQLLVLADYCNVQAAIPDFAEQYTANQIKFATTPEALTGFQRLQESFDKEWWQEDFGAATYADGLQLLADGEIAHYPMLTFALSEIATLSPEAAQNIGYFGQPGDDAASNCSTIWMPAATYISSTTEHPDEAKAFLAFVASVEGTETLTAAIPPAGPYMIKEATLPDDVLPAVQDIQAYIDAGASAPALEFLSPVKGPALEQITVAVGSGLNTAEEGAVLYDQDVEKAAQQLGLPGW
jgi:raffinose/stachyose/melibiose transport system substrate-binding protein